jgi:hypothetical protein
MHFDTRVPPVEVAGIKPSVHSLHHPPRPYACLRLPRRRLRGGRQGRKVGGGFYPVPDHHRRCQVHTKHRKRHQTGNRTHRPHRRRAPVTTVLRPVPVAAHGACPQPLIPLLSPLLSPLPVMGLPAPLPVLGLLVDVEPALPTAWGSSTE